MNNKFSKAALLSAALFGLGFAAVSANSNTANAKSYAKVKSNRAYTTNYTERNYLPSGSTALYTKAGTLKGARKVASASTLNSLANKSDKGQSYFRAYRIAKTNRGSYYLKVASFDKTYRGWIYAGKSNPSGKTAVGGMRKVSTFNQGNLTTDISNTTYYFGTSSTTYKQPDWTQYKIGRNMNSLSGDYTKDALRVTGVGTKTNGRDNNATYYFVEDSAHPTVNGWIKASDLKSGSGTGTSSSSSSTNIGANQVLVNYVDASTGNSVTTKLLTNNNSSTQTAASYLGTNLSGQAYSNIPTGYSAPGDSTQYGTSNTSALAAASYGKQVNYYVIATSSDNLFSTSPKYTSKANNRTYSGLPGDPVSKNAFTSPQGVQFSSLLSNLAKSSYTSGNGGQRTTFTSTDVFNAVQGAKMDTIYYLAYCDPMSNILDGTKQAILTASSTGTPSVSGLFGTSSSSSTSDTTDQLSAILGASGIDSTGILSGIGNIIGSGLDGIANSLFGGRICYRIVQLTTSQDAIKTANGDSIKMGTQVTIPYTATASKVVTQDAITGYQNQLDVGFTKAGTDATDQGNAFNDKTFQSSTSALSGLLTDGSGTTSTTGTGSTTSSSALSSDSGLSNLLSGLFGN
ncbi:hypothetical protein [Lentilactobacillus hilgardii]|uniref:hypothetical protein n=1 Tax=Lentilactobacillus hilgardii TaxID=1588 RepID=UPI0021C3FA75|nr:hypothetical protein [Lentilactobacillus hilgardii]MCP9334393.1 hypothetical protein [Lentilactobacillus hilgardii]MCP9350976.1 hypothetical protein [Lentilactobacillus hilgardii]MCP9353857.1 hypothetical protein [Lentilactobacillus hilgardii]